MYSQTHIKNASMMHSLSNNKKKMTTKPGIVKQV